MGGQEPLQDEKLKTKFIGFIKKLDQTNSIKTRIQVIRDVDQLIQKKNQKQQKQYNQQQQHFLNTPGSGGNQQLSQDFVQSAQFEFPFDLSIIIVKVQDLVLNANGLKKDQKIDVENQRCLVYKFPQFFLNFMEQFQDTQAKLKVNLFSSLNHIMLDYNPKAFTEPQTLSLLLRISLVGITSVNLNQTENALEVIQILQYLLKYNDFSPKLLNASLMTMCVLSNRDPFTYPVWNILKHIIIQDKKFIFQELLEILQITLKCQYFEKKDQITYQLAIRKEIQLQCFKELMNSMVIELDDLQQNLNTTTTTVRDSNDLTDPKQNPRMTIHELICKNKCDLKFYDYDLQEDIIRLEKLSQKAFAIDKNKLKELMGILLNDRTLWISTFEKNIDRVQKGAIYFVGRILWSQEKIEELNYPLSQILTVFNDLINEKSKFNVINEILGATKQLVGLKYQSLYYEWQGILNILDSLTRYIEDLNNKKRMDSIFDMFKIIRNLMLIEKFPDFLEESCLTNEKSAEIRSLFLDMVSSFYEDCEDPSIYTLLEAVFANNIEYFYLTRKDGSYTTAQIIQIIDILIIMGCKTQKSTNFRHLMQILSECINCFEFDKSNMQNDISIAGHSNIQQIKQNFLNKGTVNYLNSEQIKMKSFQQHALTRLIQIFILKSSSVEYEKAIYVYNILLTTLKLQSNDRRNVICIDLLANLKVNTYKELCWMTTDNPIFVDIKKLNMDTFEGNDFRSQSDSQGNSSGGSNYSEDRLTILLRASREASQTQIGRSSLNKLLEEKYIIQNTLKAIISCLEDDTTSSDIKLSCLKLFNKFVIYIQEDDFLNLELLEHDQQQNKQALLDGKSEWIRIVQILLKHFDPIEEPEFSFIILEIFYSLLGLQNYESSYPILSKELHQLILENLIRTLSYIQNYLARCTKIMVKFMKKVISLIGFCFINESQVDQSIWMQIINQNLQIKLAGSDQKDHRLIEYLIDQLSIVVMNDLTLPKLSQSLLVCLQNIIDSIKDNQDSLLRNTLITDYLLFLNIRIMFPYMLSKCEMADPIYRIKNNIHRMNKNLKIIFKEQFLFDELLYLYYILNNQDNNFVKISLMVSNIANLTSFCKNEDSLNAIITLVGQKTIIPDREKFGKEKNKELRKIEKINQCMIDCLTTLILWQSHSVYDRNCDIQFQIDNQERPESIHHFIWNRNIISMIQNDNNYDIYIRNPVYNYRAQINVSNNRQQISNGDFTQINKLKQLIKGEKDVLKSNGDSKKQKELMQCEDDQMLRNYLQILDQIQPKDFYAIGVYYIPKNTKQESFTNLSQIQINPSKVSKSHMHFLSMLGQIGNAKEKTKNNHLYLNAIIDCKEDIDIIVNEDNLNFTRGRAKQFGDLRMSKPGHQKQKPSTGGNAGVTNSNQSISISNSQSYQQEPRLGKFKSEMFIADLEDARDTPREQPKLIHQYSSNTTQQSTDLNKEKKFYNGFSCDYAIIHKNKVGDWVKKISILNDSFDRRHRYGKECIISNIIQRGMKIKEIKEKKINNAKFTTMLK
ncbi:UNKNOWN [Stylonychia lemnae]|uniref:Uncharacterized protein n=1 Tax=Stylonychia lemnae TaxID=5949 RepID=A0A077ZVF8_STYLE|nr:UNKNOWN [Stylonychia lemnae]|eukprot:CDW73839.1 UNKNOWN [Stylonychia lemnae]